MVENTEQWWVISPQNTDNGSGEFVADLLTSIRSVIDISHIVIGEVEGAIVYQINPDRKYYYHNLDEILPLIRQAVQFDWCDIFCFNSKNDIPEGDLSTIDYPTIISASIVSIRVIDSGTWVEIFTQSEQLYQFLIDRYQPVECFFGSLEAWTYPS